MKFYQVYNEHRMGHEGTFQEPKQCPRPNWAIPPAPEGRLAHVLALIIFRETDSV
jgi:hypothetical protein